MKIRLGFVSNSSSCSFCIYGICFEDGSEIDNKINKFNQENNDNLICESPGDSDSVFVGLNWYDIGDNETGKQFKDRVQYLLNNFCEEYKLPKSACSTHEKGWYDG